MLCHPYKSKILNARCWGDPQEHAMRLNNRGLLYIQLKQIDNAISDFEKAISLEPGIGESYYFLAKALIAKEDTISAIGSLDKTILLNDEYAPAYYEIGKIFLNLNIQKAQIYFDAARKIDPFQVDYNFKYGITLTFMKRYVDAISIFKKCLELDKHFDPPLYFLGLTYKMMNNEDEAMKYFKEYSKKSGIPIRKMLKNPEKEIKTAAEN
jgi:tetratricopeptide (TPR) repeat protein